MANGSSIMDLNQDGKVTVAEEAEYRRRQVENSTPPAPPLPGGTWSAYNPAPGTDPVWDAYVAEFTARVANRNAAAELRRRRTQADADATIAAIDFAAPDQRKSLEGSLLARGVGRSGEALRRRADLESDLLGARSAADKSRVDTLEAIDMDLATELTDLAADRERQIAESRLRLLADKETVPDVSTPGSTRPAPTSGGGKSGGSKSSGSKSSGSKSGGGGTKPATKPRWSSTQEDQPKPATKPPPRQRLVYY